MTKSSSGFPSFKGFARLNGLNKASEETRFFDCKFYPYTEPGTDPVFALIGGRETIVCRPTKSDSAAIEIIAWFSNNDVDASLNSMEWTYDRLTSAPLLCTAGQNAAINIFNVRTKELVSTLVGHGKDINDLAMSPISPWILASASLDNSVRIWSLDPGHKEQPCMLICAGEGHREGLLCLAFHNTGRYLLTGGMDNVVNLWVIPPLPDNNTGTRKPTLLHYPHFSTSALHSNVVDCMSFYGDLVISKCAEEGVIKIWRIEDFDSTAPAPLRVPTTHEVRPTRSAWGGGYQILFTLACPNTHPFWMKFGLYQPIFKPGVVDDSQQDPTIVTIGNTESKIFFWDLKALEIYPDDGSTDFLPRTVARPKASQRSGRQESVASSAADEETIQSKLRQRYLPDRPFEPLIAHLETTIPKVNFASRQIAWSTGGEWMVVVGDQGMIAVFQR